MASWTYSGFEAQATAALKLAMLQSHIGEVNAAVSADVSADGKSRSSGNLIQYLNLLQKRRMELEREAGVGGKGINFVQK